jgi:hypothetical protein
LSEKNKQKQAFENFTKLHFSGAKNGRETRERRNRDARQKQRKSRDRTRKEQGNAAHLLADYQPLN